MKPTLWGPTAWTYLHLLSFSYPDNPNREQRENIKRFLNYFGKTLPCEKCSNHFLNNISNYDLDKVLNSKNNFIDFIWKLHNKVNKTLNRDKFPFNRFIDNYRKLIDDEDTNIFRIINDRDLYRKIIFFLLFLIVIITTIFIYYRSK